VVGAGGFSAALLPVLATEALALGFAGIPRITLGGIRSVSLLNGIGVF
jgi:hypothetical protein